MAKSTNSPAEGAVRTYLVYLADADSLIDEAAVVRAQALADRAKDPIEKVRALTRLERAQTVDGDALRADFVEHAAAWIEETGGAVTASALHRYGVPEEVLAEAGLALAPNRKGRSGRKAAARPVPVRRRAPALSLETVAFHLPDGEFSVQGLAEAIDREVGTARNYIPRLLADGAIVEVGPDPDSDGRGKARTLYRRA